MKVLDSIQADWERELAESQEQRLRELVESIEMGFGDIPHDILHQNPQLRNVVCNTLYRYINELRDMRVGYDARVKMKETASEPS